MYWRLLPNLNACIASGRVILLDIERDRYSALPSAISERAIAWLRARDGSPAPDGFVAVMRATSPPATAPIGNQIFASIPISNAIQFTGQVANASLADRLSVLVAVTGTWLDLRCGKLRNILGARAKVRTSSSSVAEHTLRTRAQIFAAARRWCPIPPNCLLDSLAFDRWLGCPSDALVVFGVVGHPFEAHCWVQTGGIVLNDSYDRVSRFEPIHGV